MKIRDHEDFTLFMSLTSPINFLSREQKEDLGARTKLLHYGADCKSKVSKKFL